MKFIDMLPYLAQGGVGNLLLVGVVLGGKVLIGKITKLQKVFSEKLDQEKLNSHLLTNLNSCLEKQTFILEKYCEETKRLSEKIIDLSYDTRELSLHIRSLPKIKTHREKLNGAQAL